nr:thioredoxin family protein [Chryseobacterium sp. SORGH_AS_1175]
MKKIISGLFLFIGVLIFSQESIQFQDVPFKDLIAKAKKENKIVFIDAYASWCGPCKMMERNVFTKKSVGDYFNTNFVNARFDMEKGEGRGNCCQIRSTLLPYLSFPERRRRTGFSKLRIHGGKFIPVYGTGR